LPVAVCAAAVLGGAVTTRAAIPGSVNACSLLTPKIAQELARVTPRSDSTTQFDCEYTDGKPLPERRWSVSFDIPFRPPGESAAFLWQNEHRVFVGHQPPHVSPIARSVSGADRAFYVESTNRQAVNGPSKTIHIAWLKGNYYGHFDLQTPEAGAPTVVEVMHALHAMMARLR
jgi:hypothetical protein